MSCSKAALSCPACGMAASHWIAKQGKIGRFIDAHLEDLANMSIAIAFKDHDAI